MSVQLVRMVRDVSFGKPFTADVHPSEVANFQLGGFQVAKEVIHEQTEKETEKAQEIVIDAPVASFSEQVFTLAAAGKSNNEIAAELGVTPQKIMATKRYDFTPEQKAQLNGN